jgi:hypothetical protein
MPIINCKNEFYLKMLKGVKMKGKIKFLIRATLSIVVILSFFALPAIALAKNFDETNFSAEYQGSRIDINKTAVKVNQTIRVKLTLKYQGKKVQAGLDEYIVVFKLNGTNIAAPQVFNTKTNSSGKAILTFKARDLEFPVISGDVLKIVCRNYKSVSDYSSANPDDYGQVLVTIK